MTEFEINDKLFQDLTKREIIMDFFKNQLK